MSDPAYLGEKIWISGENPVIPEKRLFQSIVIQAIKDYITEPEEKNDVRLWAKKKLGTFKFCAMGMGIRMAELQRMMLSKLDEIDRTGETQFRYSRM